MNIKLIHNAPFVAILIIGSLIYNFVLGVPTPWTSILIWVPQYYLIFWFYQYSAKDFHKLPATIKKIAVIGIGCGLYLLALISRFIVNGHITRTQAIVDAITVVLTFLLLELSLKEWR